MVGKQRQQSLVNRVIGEIGASTTERHMVGPVEDGPIYNCVFIAVVVMYDTLPSPANLQQWGLTEGPACNLCGN